MKFKQMILRLVILSFLFLFPTFIFASDFGLVVDKTAVVFDANAGETQKFVIEVKNISDEKQKIVIDAMDYVLSDNNEVILSKDVNDQNGIKSWINTQDKNIVLSPGESEEVAFSVNVFEEAAVGSHRGAVIFKIIPNSSDTVKIQGQVGVHVLINVKGDTNATGRINFFDASFLSLGLTDYKVEFENTGNVHYVPYGEVVVTNIFTKKKEVYNYDKHFAFPQKKVEFLLSREIPSLFGLYKAQVTFVDGEGISRSKTDYVMGYFFPIVFMGSLMLIGYIFWFFHTKAKRNQNNQKTIKEKNRQQNKKKNKNKKKNTISNKKVVNIDTKKEDTVKEDLNDDEIKSTINNKDEHKISINIENK